MIVLGADMHKSSHIIAAIAAATGEALDGKTAVVGARGFDQVVHWARGLGRDRVWALEDCRHVSGSFGAISDRSRRAGRSSADAVGGQLAAL